MIKTNGYFRLHRTVFLNPVVTKDEDYFLVWIYILSQAEYEKGHKFDFGKKYNIRKLEEYNEIKEALSSRSIADKEERLAETGILYLKDKGLFDSDIILADVGWHGTTQYILKQIQCHK